jgi:type I restriction enzyme R subunit
MFADPDFDGEPTLITEVTIDEDGAETAPPIETGDETAYPLDGGVVLPPPYVEEGQRRKLYFDGGQVEIAAHLVYELDVDGTQLRVVTFTDYTAEKVRTLYPTAVELREAWSNPEHRSEVIAHLAERGIDFDELARAANQPDADPFDLLCHLAFNAPLRTRRERAQALRRDRTDFFDRYAPQAREILDELLEKYAEHGTAQFLIPDVLKVEPISRHGNVMEISALFEEPERLRQAVNQLQTLLYAA